MKELGDRDIFQHIGAFGENISSSGVTEKDICMGDKIRIGSTYLEVSQRQNALCWKLNVRFEQNDMAKRLQTHYEQGGTSGCYKRGILGKVTRSIVR